MRDSERLFFNGQLIQTAFITDDIHRSMKELTRSLGVGPWHLRERGVFAKQVYRGTPCSTALAIAVGYAGDMQFEIIQQLDDSASVYREHVERKGYGLHHYGMAATDYTSACEHYLTMGFTLAYEAEVGHGARVAYFDTHGHLPVMVEVIEFLPGLKAMCERFRASACNWDGREPVRLRP